MDAFNFFKVVVVLTALCFACYGDGYRRDGRRLSRKCGANGNGVCVKSSRCDGYPIPGSCDYGSVCCQQFQYSIPCQFDDKLYYGYYANMSVTDTYLNIFAGGKYLIFTNVELVLGRFLILRWRLFYWCFTFDEIQSGPNNIVFAPPERRFEFESPLDLRNLSNICTLCSTIAPRVEYVGFTETFCTSPPGCGGPNECDDFGNLDKFNKGCHNPRRYSYYSKN